MDRADLDRLLDEELRQLPAPRAPRTLLPRVIAATAGLQTPAAPATGWFTWSWTKRAASIGAFGVVAVLILLAVRQPPDSVAKTAQAASDATTVVRVFWDVLLQPLAVYFFALGVLFTLACAAAWAAMELALGGASQR
jgi:hypothetical protein